VFLQNIYSDKIYTRLFYHIDCMHQIQINFIKKLFYC